MPLTFWWRWRDGWEDRLSNDIVWSSVDVFFPDADMLRIQQSLSNHVVSTLATVCLAVGTELTERQSFRWRRGAINSLSDDVVAAVVVVWSTLIVRRWLPRRTRYWLAEDVVTETLQTQFTKPIDYYRYHTDVACCQRQRSTYLCAAGVFCLFCLLVSVCLSLCLSLFYGPVCV